MTYTDEQILDYAKIIVKEEYSNYAYPVYPIDDDGNTDSSLDIGQVPWCSVTKCEVVNAKIDEIKKEDEEILVLVTLDLEWMDDENELIEDNDREFLITVYTGYSTLEHGYIDEVD